MQGLPKDVLIKYVNAASSYSVGVSRGRKGHPNLESQEMASFYANPLQVCATDAAKGLSVSCTGQQ